ncbi:hypothetical protein BDZ89DRAFT_1101554 [Hymenopellis radicata]|nr:hypothetical protein BDZ89DRAFT_1101554 [Hymenopellis radicata]
MLKSLKTTLTFVTILILALALVQSVEAKGHARQAVAQRDHANLNRFIRKRAPQTNGGAGGASNGGGNSASQSASEAGSSSRTTSAPPSTSTTTTSSSTSSSSSSSSTTSNLLSSIISDLTSSTSSSSSSSTISTTTTSATTSATTQQPTTVSVDAVASATASDSNAEQTGSTSSSSGTALTVIIAVAASIGFVIVCWTIFRKWKLARSEKFDRRLNPIDWQPTNESDGPSVPGSHRRGNSDTSSFHSGANHAGYGSPNGSDSGHGAPQLQPIPDHDFTAGAPAYNTGYGDYADLNRGPSMNRGATPQPPMAELARGPSVARPAYDVGVPIHHQTGYGATDAYDYNTGNPAGRY